MKHSLVRTKYRLGPPLHALTKKFGRFLVCLFAFPLLLLNTIVLKIIIPLFPSDRGQQKKAGRLQIKNQATIIRYNNCVDEEKA